MMKATRWAGLLLAFFVLSGCDEGNPFDKKYVPPQIKPPPRRDLTVRKQTIDFVYVPINKRDPFRPPYLTQAVLSQDDKKKKPDVGLPTKRRAPQTELEKYELDQLTVVATVTGVANPVAMVRDPNGHGHMVRRGTVIGKNAGRVKRIHTDGLVIAEEKRDNTGRLIVSRVKLRIKRQGAGSKKKGSTSGMLLIGGRRIKVNGDSL